MKPIWYFVGLILLIMGILITGAGIYDLIEGTEVKSVLGELHPNIWWGGIMVIVGIIYVVRNSKVKVE